MKKAMLLVASVLVLTSCENTWDGEARDMFVQGCINAAKKKDMNEADAKTMCDCRLEVMMELYPNFSKAMENLDKVMRDTSFLKCEPH